MLIDYIIIIVINYHCDLITNNIAENRKPQTIPLSHILLLQLILLASHTVRMMLLLCHSGNVHATKCLPSYALCCDSRPP